MVMLTEDMDEMMRQYFVWSQQQDPADLAFPHQTPERRLMGSSVRSISLSDDDALHINQALGMLKSDDEQNYRIIKLYYQDRRSFRWMESRRMGDRKALARRMADGLHFIRGVLFVCAS